MARTCPASSPLAAALGLTLVGLFTASTATAGPPSTASDRQGRPVVEPETGAPLNYLAPGEHPADLAPRSAARRAGVALRPTGSSLVDTTLSRDPMPSRRGPAGLDPALLRLDATIGSFNQQLAVTGLHALDVDDDGVDEVIVGHTSMWYLLRWVPSRNDYVQVHWHEAGVGLTFGGGSLVELAVGELDGDPEPEVAVLFSDKTLAIHDAATGVLEQELALDMPRDPDGLHLADIDATPLDEVLVFDDDGLLVYQAGTTTAEWTVPGAQGDDLAIGNFDDDPAVELAIARRGDGWMVDAELRSIEWMEPLGFGSHVDAGDVDGDGRDEIVGADTWGDFFVVDADTRTRKFSIDNFNTSAVRALDFDGDTLAEVLLGDAQWGDVQLRDGNDGSSLGAIRNPEHSVANIVLGDVDGDCTRELLWGAGYSSTGSDRLYVGDLATATIEWENVENDGPMHCFGMADVDADGRTEVLRASSESDAGYDGALVFVSDLHHRRDEHVPTMETNDGWMITQSLVLAQLDADPALEYVINGSRTYTGRIKAFDSVTHEQQWESIEYDAEFVAVIMPGDPDGNGLPDVVVGTGRETTGADGTFLRVHDALTGELRFQTPDLGGAWSGVVDIAIGNVDGDEANEIVASHDGQLFVFDGETEAEELALSLPGVGPIELFDLDGDGDLDILTGTAGGTLVGVENDTFTELFTQPISTGSIDSLRLVDLNDDDVTELLLTTFLDGSTNESRLRIHDLNTADLLWESPWLAGRAGLANSLQVADADDDGRLEIAVSTAQGLHFFELADGPVDSLSPTYPGAVGLQSIRPIFTPDCCPAVDLEWADAFDDLSPPIEFVIHRGTTPDFVPDATTELARTRELSWRDATVAPATRYHYLVQAEDRLGNRETNDARMLVDTADATVPDAADLISVADRTDCAQDGVEITFTHSDVPAGAVLSLLVDGFVVATGITSPHVYIPGDADDHVYAIQAGNPACPLETLSVETVAADLGAVAALPSTSVVDADDCALGEVEISFTHVGFPVAGRYALLVDGEVVADPVSSPVRHVPGDDALHSYAIRAIDEDCGSEVDSMVFEHADGARFVEPPVITAFEDTDPCGASPVTLRFTHPGFVGAGRYELWRDGMRLFSPISDGATFPPGDASVHEYVVKAIDEDCGLESDSLPFEFADGTGTPLFPVITIVDLEACALGMAELRIDHPGFVGDGHYELWRDGAVFVNPVTDGATFSTVDGVPHDYFVRAVDDLCLSSTDSLPVTHVDTVGQLPEPDIRLARNDATGDTVTLSWDGGLAADEVNVYVGSLLTLSAGYDHVSQPAGLTFPDSPSTDSGCQLGAIASGSARVEGLESETAVYFLLSTASPSCGEGSVGRDSRGEERWDLDPRMDVACR